MLQGNKKIGVGFILTLVALVASVGALGMFLYTYNVFGYTLNRWAFSFTLLACWLLLFLVVNTFLAGGEPYWTRYAYTFICFFLLYAALAFIKPCLSPIGIYFTVHDMGDVETNAVGVPASLATAALYLVAFFLSTVAAFMGTAADKKLKRAKAKGGKY